MNADQILTEIREANLSYLMLAQSLIRTDRDQALFRLGINEDTAALIGTLLGIAFLLWRWRKQWKAGNAKNLD
jgi:hypothetical protein